MRRTLRRPLKFPVSAIIGERCGHESLAYRLTYALEQWAMKHGYKGHSPHNVRKKSDMTKQTRLKL